MKALSQMRTAKKIVGRAMMGIALAAMALCIGSLRTSAARRRSAIAARESDGAAKARLRSVAYKTRHRRRRRWHRRHHVTLPKEPSRDRTEQIQSALERGGYYTGEPNGRWGEPTQNALRRFQEANGLPPTGKLDALSLQKMGLGSDVAGLSAPKPVASGNPPSSQPPTPPAPSTPKTPGIR